MAGKYADVQQVLLRDRYNPVGNSPEEVRRAIRNVCGAQTCKGAEDAKLVLNALGLKPIKEKQ